MIITVKKGIPEEEVKKLVHTFEERGFQVNDSQGTDYHILGLIGDTTSLNEKIIQANPLVPIFCTAFQMSASFCIFLILNISSDHLCDDSSFLNHRLEFFWLQRLCSVTPCLLRIVVHLHDQTICACCNRRKAHRFYKIPITCCMRRINNDRQVALLLYDRNNTEIQRVSRITLKGTDPPLTKNDILISAGHNIFCRHQPFFDCIGKSSL